jgi:outer membrane immunogenic protein
MRKSIFVALLSLAGIYPAMAVSPVPVVPMYNWTGCYIGASVGRGSWFNQYTDPLAVPPDFFLGSHTAESWLGGGQGGCDYQIGQFIVGFQGSLMGGSPSATHLGIEDLFPSSASWVGTATARLGHTITPNLIIYGQAGFAWTRDHETKIDVATGLLEGTADASRTGWTVGVGGEYLITQHVSVFADYNFMDFGTNRTIYITPDIPPAFFPLDIKQQVQTVRVGLNVRFNPFGMWPAPH